MPDDNKLFNEQPSDKKSPTAAELWEQKMKLRVERKNGRMKEPDDHALNELERELKREREEKEEKERAKEEENSKWGQYLKQAKEKAGKELTKEEEDNLWHEFSANNQKEAERKKEEQNKINCTARLEQLRRDINEYTAEKDKASGEQKSYVQQSDPTSVDDHICTVLGYAEKLCFFDDKGNFRPIGEDTPFKFYDAEDKKLFPENPVGSNPYQNKQRAEHQYERKSIEHFVRDKGLAAGSDTNLVDKSRENYAELRKKMLERKFNHLFIRTRFGDQIFLNMDKHGFLTAYDDNPANFIAHAPDAVKKKLEKPKKPGFFARVFHTIRNSRLVTALLGRAAPDEVDTYEDRKREHEVFLDRIGYSKPAAKQESAQPAREKVLEIPKEDADKAEAERKPSIVEDVILPSEEEAKENVELLEKASHLSTAFMSIKNQLTGGAGDVPDWENVKAGKSSEQEKELNERIKASVLSKGSEPTPLNVYKAYEIYKMDKIFSNAENVGELDRDAMEYIEAISGISDDDPLYAKKVLDVVARRVAEKANKLSESEISSVSNENRLYDDPARDYPVEVQKAMLEFSDVGEYAMARCYESNKSFEKMLADEIAKRREEDNAREEAWEKEILERGRPKEGIPDHSEYDDTYVPATKEQALYEIVAEMGAKCDEAPFGENDLYKAIYIQTVLNKLSDASQPRFDADNNEKEHTDPVVQEYLNVVNEFEDARIDPFDDDADNPKPQADSAPRDKKPLGVPGDKGKGIMLNPEFAELIRKKVEDEAQKLQKDDVFQWVIRNMGEENRKKMQHCQAQNPFLVTEGKRLIANAFVKYEKKKADIEERRADAAQIEAENIRAMSPLGITLSRLSQETTRLQKSCQPDDNERKVYKRNNEKIYKAIAAYMLKSIYDKAYGEFVRDDKRPNDPKVKEILDKYGQNAAQNKPDAIKDEVKNQVDKLTRFLEKNDVCKEFIQGLSDAEQLGIQDSYSIGGRSELIDNIIKKVTGEEKAEPEKAKQERKEKQREKSPADSDLKDTLRLFSLAIENVRTSYKIPENLEQDISDRREVYEVFAVNMIKDPIRKAYAEVCDGKPITVASNPFFREICDFADSADYGKISGDKVPDAIKSKVDAMVKTAANALQNNVDCKDSVSKLSSKGKMNVFAMGVKAADDHFDNMKYVFNSLSEFEGVRNGMKQLIGSEPTAAKPESKRKQAPMK